MKSLTSCGSFPFTQAMPYLPSPVDRHSSLIRGYQRCPHWPAAPSCPRCTHCFFSAKRSEGNVISHPVPLFLWLCVTDDRTKTRFEIQFCLSVFHAAKQHVMLIGHMYWSLELPSLWRVITFLFVIYLALTQWQTASFKWPLNWLSHVWDN